MLVHIPEDVDRASGALHTIWGLPRLSLSSRFDKDVLDKFERVRAMWDWSSMLGSNDSASEAILVHVVIQLYLRRMTLTMVLAQSRRR
jgi:hypothetical protein